MNPVKRIAKREIAQLLNNRTIIIFAIILPFVSFLFFHGLFNNGVVRDLPIAVIDHDNSGISRNIIAQLDATPELQVNFYPLSEHDGEELIKTGKAIGLITIPKDIQNHLKSGKQVNIINQYNSNILLPGGLEYKAFNKVIGTISAGIFIQKKLKSGMSKQQALTNYQAVNLNSHVISNPYTNYSYYLNTGFLTLFFHIFVILTTIYIFGIDLKYGKANKLLRISHGQLVPLILGKLIPYTIWFFFVGLIMLYTMFVWHDFPLNGSKLTIIIGMLLFIITTQSFALLIISISKSFRTALTIGSGFAAISLSFSGITFPIFGMPKLLQWMSQIFPYTHFFNFLLEQSQQGFPVYYSLKALVILLVLFTITLILAWKNLKNLFISGAFKSSI
jgi:ABC-2 type transport system permease protein